MQEINRRIGQKIKEVREEKGITQKELGGYLGYSPMGISYFEQGEREMKLSDIERVAKYFGKKTSYFLSAGTTIFRADGGGDPNITKSLENFDKFLIERKRQKEQ